MAISLRVFPRNALFYQHSVVTPQFSLYSGGTGPATPQNMVFLFITLVGPVPSALGVRVSHARRPRGPPQSEIACQWLRFVVSLCVWLCQEFGGQRPGRCHAAAAAWREARAYFRESHVLIEASMQSRRPFSNHATNVPNHALPISARLRLPAFCCRIPANKHNSASCVLLPALAVSLVCSTPEWERTRCDRNRFRRRPKKC